MGHCPVAPVTTDPFGCGGSEDTGCGVVVGPWGDRNFSEAGRASGGGQDEEVLGLQIPVYNSLRFRDPAEGELGHEDPEAEVPPEEEAAEVQDEASEVQEEVPSESERALERDAGDIPEMSRLSITQRFPRSSVARGRQRRCRLLELAQPKTNWQVLKDRKGGRCRGYAWISPCKLNLHFCLYWPSVYWTERFLQDTTLSITVPDVSHRVDELARPKRFYLEYYNNNRTTPVWPIPRSTLECQASRRLKELAIPKIRNNIWSINMSEVSQVSRAAQMAIPSSRILRLAKPRAPAVLLREWDPMPKPKPRVLDYGRLLSLAMPKVQSDKCVPDRDPRWEVLDVTKRAVASPRVIALAQPRVRRCLNEGYDPYRISPASLVAQASPRLHELATPKIITKKV